MTEIQAGAGEARTPNLRQIDEANACVAAASLKRQSGDRSDMHNGSGRNKERSASYVSWKGSPGTLRRRQRQGLAGRRGWDFMRIQADPQVRCEEQKNALRNKVRSADVTVSRRAEAAGRRRSEGGGLRRDAGFWELCCGGQQRLSLPSPWKTEGISKSATALSPLVGTAKRSSKVRGLASAPGVYGGEVAGTGSSACLG